MDKCPKCGSPECVADGICISFACGTLVSIKSNLVDDSKVCLRRQLDAANKKIVELEQELEAYKWERDEQPDG